MKTATEISYTIERAHALSGSKVLEVLAGTDTGLSANEASKRLETIGLNRLPEAPREGLLRRFFKHFHDLLIYILIAAACLTAAMGHWVDTGVILGVVIINAIIGFLQEGKAEQALAGIRKMLSVHAEVRRDGNWTNIEADELVPGDIVRLRSGDRVPADVRLLEAVNLRIEESALTGESVPAGKSREPTPADSGIGDRHGMAYSGTLVAAGRGTGVVTATGAATELGRINRMISEVQTLATPLTRQMNSFGKVLSIVIVGLAVLMWLVGWLLHDYTTGELLLASIGFAVAAIPEGLPAILTITLALGVTRMARRQAITRKLNAVETLGSVTVVCSDKTGTLTRNEMTARHVVTSAGRYEVSGTGYRPDGEITLGNVVAEIDEQADLHALIEVMALCNDSNIAGKDGHWKVTGEPTEGALLALARKAAFSENDYKRIAVVPFESNNKFMATLHRVPDGSVRILFKGAPDRLLDRCTMQFCGDHGPGPLDHAFWEKQIAEFSSQGLRLLAAAVRDAKADKSDLGLDDLESDMVFLGLVGIIDPPRPEAIKAIKACHQAGIRVKMITGDHAGTAMSIGREMGIGNGKRAITGTELEAASDEDLRQLVRDHDIFARTSPEHKLRLVKALQINGDVVAMTGDGVNDAPALKRADVGVAMGIKGTEATKEAADIVLADDNFASIERAIEEGRTIYDNLRKSILFVLPTNGAEALVILVAVVLGLVLPLTPVQILWVNMVTAVTLAMALAFEPAESDVMSRPPRDPRASILGRAFLWRIAFVSVLIGGATIAVFLIAIRMGMPVELARTLAVNTLVCAQVFYLFNSRFLRESSLSFARLFTNRAVWIAVGVLAVLQLVFVYAPFMHRLFGSTALEFHHWLMALGIGLAVFLVIEAEKAVMRRFAGAGKEGDRTGIS
ncbi:MAG: cation-transporting P-type ATPase [Terrimicrobiaceae bacterium]